jgi:hypothetical protein
MSTGPRKKILIAGASGVGKTWLLAAIERASLQNQTGQPRITFSPSSSVETHKDPDNTPIDDASDSYLRAAADFFLLGKNFRATLQAQRYGFNLGVQHPGKDDPETFEFLDAPGEFTSPSQSLPDIKGRQGFLDEARQGYALVFCFEALSKERAAEALWNLEINLSNLLRNLTSAAGRINYERILFLLTKVDVLTSVFHDRLKHQRFAAPMTPLMLAQRIDPLEQMRAIVGSESISKFRIPGSKVAIAVGVSSAIGFDSETGYPMVSPYSELPFLPEGRTPEQHYLRWTPFGVREALLFLTTGQSHSTLRVVTDGDADSGERPRITFVPYLERNRS